MKKIEDYLHLHIGCNARFWQGVHTWDEIMTAEFVMRYGGRLDWMKPILRPIESMIEDEAYEVLSRQHNYQVIPANHEVATDRFISYRLRYNQKRSNIKHDFFPVQPRSAEATRYLLSRHFDLFGLIDAGLAIDSTL